MVKSWYKTWLESVFNELAFGLRGGGREFFIDKEDDANIGCDMDEISRKTLVKASQSLIPIDGFLVQFKSTNFSLVLS